jgi:hypothetical protein
VYVRLLALAARTVLASSVASGRSTFGATLPRSSTAIWVAGQSLDLALGYVKYTLDVSYSRCARPPRRRRGVRGPRLVHARRSAGRLSADQIALVFPTIKNLEQLREFPSARALLDYAGGRDVQSVSSRARSPASCFLASLDTELEPAGTLDSRRLSHLPM